MEVNFMNFVDNLKYMGIGMLGIFLIIAIIMGATYLINYTTAKIGKNKDSENQD